MKFKEGKNTRHLIRIGNPYTLSIRIANPNEPGSLGYRQFFKILNPYDFGS